MFFAQRGRICIAAALMLIVPLNSALAVGTSDCVGTITFPGAHLNSAIKKFSGTGPFDALTGVTLQNTDIVLGPPHHDEDYLGKVFEFSMLLTFDATSMVDQWRQAIIQQAAAQSGCSDARVHTIDFVIGPDDTWIGTFHLDYKKRACFDYWWFGTKHAQIDLAEVNLVYTNTLKIGIDAAANKITTQFTPSATSNVPDWLKPILQFFENVIGILTLGFVSPGDHVLSGINQQDQILSDMGKYAVGLINDHLKDVSSGPASTDKQLDYLNHLVHTSVRFSKPSPRPVAD